MDIRIPSPHLSGDRETSGAAAMEGAPVALARFLTLFAGSPRTYGVVVDARRSAPVSRARIGALSPLAHDHPGACAFGKVAVLDRGGIRTYQVAPDGACRPAFCGNSTAAALRMMGGGHGQPVEVRGSSASPCTTHYALAGNDVMQTWRFAPSPVIERTWRERPVFQIDALNPYAIVAGPLPHGLLPEDALVELVGPDCAAKLAVIEDVGPVPFVRFYNSNGAHGAAPQTGVASLALAAAASSRLARVLEGGTIAFGPPQAPRHAALPRIRAEADGSVALAMPRTKVELSPVDTALAA